MADKTCIEWTDATWNPTTGCVKVSSGCKHCYAERDWARLVHLPAYAGRSFTDVACHPDRLDQPLRWKKPRRIFVNSMSDLFHESVPDTFIDQVFSVMAMAPQHTFQVLTKRPQRVRDYFAARREGDPWADAADAIADLIGLDDHPVVLEPRDIPLPNVWIGVSVENQEAADERIPLLLQIPSNWRWISAEPLLGPVDLTLIPHKTGWGSSPCSGCGTDVARDALDGSTHCEHGCDGPILNTLDWVVVGGESGPKARPMHPAWARSLRDQCAAAGVPFLFKQWGEWLPDNQNPDVSPPHDKNGAIRVGKKRAGRLLDGVQHDGYPEGGA